MTEDISYLSILYLLILLIPIIVINYRLNITINKKIFNAILRMGVQLTLVGVFLQYIFDLNDSLINSLYIIFMIAVAAFSTIKSCSMKWKEMFLPFFISFVIPNVFVLIYFNAAVVQLDNIFEAQYYIPIIGMLLGNSLRGNIIGVNKFYNSIKGREKEYFYRLCLSGNKLEALMPYYREAVKSSINPILASIETIGLVALPGMMTGQILGGSIPMTAIKYQIAIMIAIFIARYFSIHLAIILTGLKSFNEYDVLN